jgi:hypothetical protein
MATEFPEFRDFQDILTDLDDGNVHRELTAKLREVVRGVLAAKQPGALTIKLSVRLEGERQIVVNAKVTPTIPAAKPGMTMFFPDESGDLRKEDPKQQPLRHLDRTTPAALRTLDGAPRGV